MFGRVKRRAFYCGLFLLSVALVLPGVSFGGAGAFVALPPLPKGKDLRPMIQQSSPLAIKVGHYRSGKLAIKVRNKTTKSAKFVADGLYFIPVLPESEMPGADRGRARIPQRVVVAGLVSYKGKSVSSVKISAKKTVSVILPVFCLDAHRPAPQTGQAFRVAQSRLPAELRQAIVSGTSSIERQHNGVVKLSRIQGHVWKVRAKDWIVLEGELSNEQVKRKTYQSSHPSTGSVDEPRLKLY